MKRFAVFFIAFLLIIQLTFPGYALSNEITTMAETTPEFSTNESESYVISFYVVMDSTIPCGTDFVLKIRRIDKHDNMEYTASLSSFNGYYEYICVNSPGVYEIYDGYGAGDGWTAPIEYVQFKCTGKANTSIPIIIGDINNIENIPESPDRINQPGQKIQNIEYNINHYAIENGFNSFSSDSKTETTISEIYSPYTNTYIIENSISNFYTQTTIEEKEEELTKTYNKAYGKYIIILLISIILIVCSIIYIKKKQTNGK